MTVAFGVVGAVAGSAIPGVGWKLGWSIGTVVGGLIEGVGRNTNIDGGRISDLKISGSSYGTFIPRVWGEHKVPGTIIWALTDANGNHLVEHSETESHGGGGSGGMGGGGSSTTYWASTTIAVAFAQTTFINADNTLSHRNFTLKRVYADDKLIWDVDEGTHKVDITWHDGSETQTQDSTIVAADGADVPAYRGIAYITIVDFDLRDFGNRVPNISAVISCDDTIYLSDICTDICKMSGLESTEYDFTDAATQQVLGYYQGARVSGASIIDELSTLFLYNIVEVDGKIYCTPEGSASVGTLTSADLNWGADSPNGNKVIQTQSEVPTRVDIVYYDGDIIDSKRSFLQKTQGDVRQVEDVYNTLTVTTNCVLTSAVAKKLAASKLDKLWSENISRTENLSPDWMHLSPGDTVTLDGTNYSIISQSYGLPLTHIEVNMVPVNLDFVNQTISTSEGGTTNIGEIVIYPTTFQAFSPVEIKDEHRKYPGFYVAATGADGWTGCTIYYSLDSEVTWVQAGFITGRTKIGDADTSLSSAGAVAGSYDLTNTVNVTLDVTGTLEDATEAEIDAGKNYAYLGGEIIAYQIATLIGTRQYTLEFIKRGLRSTTMSGHSIGDRFVYMNENVARVTVPVSMIGQVVKVRCVSRYQEISDVASVNVTIATPTPESSDIGGTVDGGTSGSILFIDSNLKLAQDNTKLFWDDTNNQLVLSQTGSAGGILFGGDCQWYRSAANVIRTPDSLVVDTQLGIGTGSTIGFMFEIKKASNSLIRAINTSTSGSGAGAGVAFVSDDGAALSSGDRLGFLHYSGSRDASNTINNSAAIVGYAAENWTGSSCAADLTFETCPTGSTTRTERMRISSTGAILIATTITNTGYSLVLGNGGSAFNMGMNRRQSNNAAGNKLVIVAGGATDTTGGFTLATDKNGGDLELRSGISTGTGYSAVKLRAPILGSTGTTDRTPTTLFEVNGSVTGGAIGFFGVTPVGKPSAYTVTNPTTDRSYDCNATTLDELADVVGTLIADLKLYGLLQ